MLDQRVWHVYLTTSSSIAVMAIFYPPDKSLPVETFEDLLPALDNVLKAVYDARDGDEAQHKLAIAAATDDLKMKLARARELVDGLPGGEMLRRDQDQAIEVLQKLRDQRRAHLLSFVTRETSDAVREREREPEKYEMQE